MKKVMKKSLSKIMIFIFLMNVFFVKGGLNEDARYVYAAEENLLAQPTNVQAIKNNEEVTITWDEVDGASGYNVKRSEEINGSYIVIATNIPEATFTDSTVEDGKKYYYVVTAVAGDEESEESEYNNVEINEIIKEEINEEIKENPQKELLAPTNVTVKVENKNIIVRWDNVINAGSYNIKRKTLQEKEYKIIKERVTDTTYVDSDLINGITYYYVITANNEEESKDSIEVFVKANIDQLIEEKDKQPIEEITKPEKLEYELENKDNLPSTPTNILVENGNKSVKLKWKFVNGSLTYKVKRGTNSGGPYSLVADNINVNSYIDNNVSNGTTYYYIISSVNSVGESEYSNEVTAIPDITKPAAPTNIDTVTGDKRVNITWSKVDNADSYTIKRGTSSGGSYTLVKNNITTTSYTDSALTNGTTYYYIISAKNEKGESEFSKEIEVVPGVQKPKNVIIQVEDNAINISWDPVASASIYKVKRSENIEGPYTVLGAGVTPTNYRDDSITKNKIYYYVISAVNTIGESPNTQPVSAIVKDSKGKRYILLITLTNGMQKEYDIDTSIAMKFINWYTNRANGIGNPLFILFNDKKDEVFGNSKDYICFNTILYYQLNEYEVHVEE
jgi:fibronectin type 3 domain-containing protein